MSTSELKPWTMEMRAKYTERLRRAHLQALKKCPGNAFIYSIMGVPDETGNIHFITLPLGTLMVPPEQLPGLLRMIADGHEKQQLGMEGFVQ